MILPPHTHDAYRLLYQEGVIDDLLQSFLDSMWRNVLEVEAERYRSGSEATTALKARLLEAMHNIRFYTKQIFPKPPRPRRTKTKCGEQMRLL